MIDFIKIRNFQTHEKLTVELDPLVTTITGSSDIGKSSIIRALKWVTSNRPTGNAFIRYGSDETAVKIEVDGKLITRRKSSAENSYDLDGKKFKAFGSDVPSEIVTLLNLDEVNFQGQHDSPWWFMRTPGEVSRELNQIINLGLIDSTLANVAAELRKVRAWIGVSKERLAVIEKEKEILAWVPKANEDLQATEQLCSEIIKKRLGLTRIKELLDKGSKLDNLIQNATGANLGGFQALEMGRKALDSSERVDRLRKLIKLAGEWGEEECQKKKEAKVIEKQLASQENCPLCGNPFQNHKSHRTS